MNRRRRKSVRRRGRSRVPAGLILMGLALVAVVTTLLLVNWVFTVRELKIAGNGDISAQTVARMSGIVLGTRMRSVDVERVRGGVENDGRLAFVKLERKYPGAMLLTVRPRIMEAMTMQAGKALALDGDGYVMSVLTQLPEQNLPYVSGLRPAKYTVGRRLDILDGRVPAMSAILAALKANGLTGSTAEVSLASLKDIRVITRKGTTVLLGTAENIDRKIAWMAGAVADIEARGETGGELDVSSATKADYKPPVSLATEEPPAEGIAAEGEAAAQEGESAEAEAVPQS